MRHDGLTMRKISAGSTLGAGWKESEPATGDPDAEPTVEKRTKVDSIVKTTK
jgi:hypothetical protein